MNGLRNFLAWSYAGIAAALIFPIVSSLFGVGDLAHVDSVFIAMSLPTVALMAISSWLLLAHKSYGRYFGLAVSFLFLILIGFIGLRQFRDLWQVDLIFLAYAIAGFVAFLPGKSYAAPRYRSVPAASEGDGTRNLINKSVPVIAAIGFIAFILWSESYGLAHGADSDYLLVYPVAVLVIGFLVVVVHECGHALAAKLLGMHLLAFVAGPLQWQWKYARGVRFRFVPSGALSLRGYILAVPISFDDFRRRKILLLLAGPVINLVTGLMALPLTLQSLSRFPQLWPCLSTFTALSFLVCVFSLVPHRTKCNYSDGAKIYQLFVGSRWADYERTVSEAYSSIISPLRARDWDVETLARALPGLTSPPQKRANLLLQYASYLDRRDDSRAAALFREAAEYRPEPSELTPETYRSLTFGNAFVLRDATQARRWWDELAAKDQTEPKEGSWLSYSALLWIEGDPKQAREAWQKGRDWAEKLPKAGIYEAERDIARRLDVVIRESEEVVVLS